MFPARNSEPGGTMARRTAVLIGAFLLIVGVVTAQPHPFNVNDLVAMQRVADPQASPDGSHVAFVVTSMDLEANKGRKDLWIAATDGSGARRLTSDAANDWSPRWADNDVLYFLSSRSGSAQVWRAGAKTGDVERVSHLSLDVEALSVGPGGGALYAGIAVFPDCADSISCTADRLAAHGKTAVATTSSESR